MKAVSAELGNQKAQKWELRGNNTMRRELKIKQNDH